MGTKLQLHHWGWKPGVSNLKGSRGGWSTYRGPVDSQHPCCPLIGILGQKHIQQVFRPHHVSFNL